jgi:hypothetical protein
MYGIEPYCMVYVKSHKIACTEYQVLNLTDFLQYHEAGLAVYSTRLGMTLCP